MPDDTIKIGCPHCKAAVRVRADKIGRKMKCNACERVFVIEGPEPPPEKPTVVDYRFEPEPVVAPPPLEAFASDWTPERKEIQVSGPTPSRAEPAPPMNAAPMGDSLLKVVAAAWTLVCLAWGYLHTSGVIEAVEERLRYNPIERPDYSNIIFWGVLRFGAVWVVILIGIVVLSTVLSRR